MNTRPELVVNLVSAILVLVIGFYALLFVQLPLASSTRVFIGGLLVLYFLIRMKYFLKKYREAKGDIERHDHNKILDKDGN